MPSVQFLQPVAPVASWYVPASHRSHVPRPPVAVKLPGRQSTHTLALLLPGTGFAFPAWHEMHASALDAPVDGLKDPAGHCSNVIEALAAPTLEQKPPVEQLLQVAAPGEALKVPTPHGSHETAPTRGACEPNGQLKHMTLPLKLE